MSGAEFQPDPDAVRDACGDRFETETLCTDCHAGRGSCCSAEFNGRFPECEKVGKTPHANAPGAKA